MLRILLTIVLPILLPLLVYGAYIYFARRRTAKSGAGAHADWDATPWIWLGAAGLVLMTAVLILVRVFTPAAEPGTEQVEPPRFIDGELQPSRISPREPAPLPDGEVEE